MYGPATLLLPRHTWREAACTAGSLGLTCPQLARGGEEEGECVCRTLLGYTAVPAGVHVRCNASALWSHQSLHTQSSSLLQVEGACLLRNLAIGHSATCMTVHTYVYALMRFKIARLLNYRLSLPTA